MNRLRTRLMLVFLAATLVPVAATLILTSRLLDHSISLNPTSELDAASRALEATGRALFQTTCEALRAEVQNRAAAPAATWSAAQPASPADAREFFESGESEQCTLGGQDKSRVELWVRSGETLRVYHRAIAGPAMSGLRAHIVQAREMVERLNARDLRRGFNLTLILMAVAVWAVSAVAVLYLSRRISRPMEKLTAGLSELAAGNLDKRLEPEGADEIVAAMRAFNETAGELQNSRDKLVQVTRLESWQTLARKMAHEVKNSLTPIRLTMEEIVARKGERDEAFIEQAAQIVVDEVGTLERRVRAFTEFASEPPVRLEDVDLRSALEERIALLRAAHPEVEYSTETSNSPARARADADLVKGVLTNLLENAAQAAGPGGAVLGKVRDDGGAVVIEVHDSGPGLSEQARCSLFEPTISFKKAGMGLGLSIARRSAVLLGGDIVVVESELGGAGFRVMLPRAEDNAGTACVGG